MERAIKYFKSGTDAKMNVVCGLITVISVLLYKIYEFKCPCIPGLNKPYALMIIFAPPLIFFFVGVVISQYCTTLALECSRPEGNRQKDKKVLRQIFIAMLIRALAPPIVWLLICLLDGKPIVCAFSESMDPEQFGGFDDFLAYDKQFLLAKVPCKNFELLRSSSTRKAISRFLKFLSQGIGYITILTFIVLGAIARIVAPMLNPVSSLQVRYWSKYTDVEEKCFEEMCINYNRQLAKKSIKGYFGNRSYEDEMEYEEIDGDRTDMADSTVETLVYVDKWYNCRPPILGAEPPS